MQIVFSYLILTDISSVIWILLGSTTTCAHLITIHTFLGHVFRNSSDPFLIVHYLIPVLKRHDFLNRAWSDPASVLS